MRQGIFELQLNENVYSLRCTPAALRFVENKHGGIRNVLQKLYLVEFQTMVDLVTAGLLGGPEFNKSILEEEIFKHGILELSVTLIDYVNLLGSGGKQPVKDDNEASNEGEN